MKKFEKGNFGKKKKVHKAFVNEEI